VSRLHNLKWISLLPDALIVVRDTEIKCLVAGEGDEYDRLAQRIKDNGLEGQAVLLGRVSCRELADYYKFAGWSS
jgi:glycosyltransferase involved in cell wall biosynthesis